MSPNVILGTACMAVAAVFILCHYLDPHRRRRGDR